MYTFTEDFVIQHSTITSVTGFRLLSTNHFKNDTQLYTYTHAMHTEDWTNKHFSSPPNRNSCDTHIRGCGDIATEIILDGLSTNESSRLRVSYTYNAFTYKKKT